MKRTIECDSCNFEGTLIYQTGDFSPSDICFCPACGADIEEPYNLSDEEVEDSRE